MTTGCVRCSLFTVQLTTGEQPEVHPRQQLSSKPWWMDEEGLFRLNHLSKGTYVRIL